MKNILLCNNSMGIGGVETVILNQVTAFTQKGYNVYVVAGKGVYANKVEELGGHFIECNFPEENKIDKERINRLVGIIKEKEITEIHIHKYQCILSVMPAALITGVPYFAYEHGIKDTRGYYTWNYPVYKSMFPIYFKNAYRIIAITPDVTKFTKNEYNIPPEKYVIVHNGIDFNLYNNPNPEYESKIKKVVIISRLTEEKLTTIIEGIDIFKKLLEKYPEARLEIIGGGQAKEKISEYLKKVELDYEDNSDNSTVNFAGEQTDIIKYLAEADLLLGVDRCALEAIAMKLPVVITGYDGIKGVLTKENINLALEENFSGNNMQTISLEDCVEQILKLQENKKEIIEDNYKIATEKLDCYKNYINMDSNAKINFDWIELFKLIENKENEIQEQSKDIKAKYEWIQKIEEENKQLWNDKGELQQVIAEYEEKNKSLEKELENVYNSKRWKYTEKLSNIFHRGK